MLSSFDTRKLDNIKRQAVVIESAYYDQRRIEDGIVLKTKYRNNGTSSQWGCGGDYSGRGITHRTKGGPKSVNRTVAHYLNGKRTLLHLTEEEWAAREAK